MRDVGDELLLHPGQVLELTDLALQRRGHPVERGGQLRQLVLAALHHALGQLPGGEALGDLGRRTHRAHHAAGHHEGDRGEQHQQGDAGQGEPVPDQSQRLLLAGQREHEPQLIGPGSGHRELRPHREGGFPGGARALVLGLPVAERHEAVDARAAARGQLVGQGRGHAGREHAAGGDAQPARGQVGVDPWGGDQHQLVEAGRTGGLAQFGDDLGEELADVRALRGSGRVELGLGVGEPRLGLGQRGGHLRVDQTVADLPHHQLAEQREYGDREHQRRADDAEQDRAPPHPGEDPSRVPDQIEQPTQPGQHGHAQARHARPQPGPAL